MKIKFIGLTDDLKKSVTEITEMIGFEIDDTAKTAVHIIAGESLSIKEVADEIIISYKRQNEIYRALSLLGGFFADKKEISGTARYDMLCYMADMSRNAVYNMDSTKRMIRYLAVMGYNSFMLYTEDTFELPGYKYFGHMRGRFPEAELREIDDYAYGFGIELIPCIQTLAHLATAIRWPDLTSFKDTDDILCVGNEKTYEFVDAVIAQCAKCFRSKRINIGMDEAMNIGLGKYLDVNGYKKSYEIMIEHLRRVQPICEKYGYKPMIFSDMFFRMSFGGKYIVSEGEILKEITGDVPADYNLIYWDYYTVDPQVFEHMLKCHKQFSNPKIFAAGAWKWTGFGTHNRYSIHAAKIQLDILERFNIRDIMVTGWGDNGAEASQFSVLASMLFYAERCYRGKAGDETLDKRSGECFDISFDDLMAFDLPDNIPGGEIGKTKYPINPAKYLLYNDIFEGFMDGHMDKNTAGAAYAENAEKLLALKDNKNFGYAFESIGKLCSVLAIKSDMGIRIREAYEKKNTATLEKITYAELPCLIEKIKDFLISFRNQWYKENKVFGFSAQEIRIGGLIARLESAALRLESYLNNRIPAIAEMEEPNLPLNELPSNAESSYISHVKWLEIVRSGLL